MTNIKTVLGKVLHTIHSHNLIEINDKVLVALSGGADSVYLLHILKEADVACDAAHCNFHLRGDESDRDEQFVISLCKKMNVKLHRTDFDTTDYAKKQGISIEMAARDLRYAYFEKLRNEWGYDKIAVAHHRDDNVETLLLNLTRGTGLKGLTGMQYCNGHIIRPLLDISREEIEHCCNEREWQYVTDSTNLETDATRNKIRLEIIPMLKKINPSVMDTMQETISRMNECYQLYTEAVGKLKNEIQEGLKINIRELQRITSPRTILYELLSEYGFNNAQTNDIFEHLNGESGKLYESNEWRLLRDREVLILKNKNEKAECLCNILPLEGYVKITANKDFIIERHSIDKDFNIPRSMDTVCLDMDRIEYPISVRLIQEGDKFVPLGMKNEKLISDYLTDKKRSVYDKESQLVVCSGNKIAWLVNERPDDRFRITDNTRRILKIRVINH